ncbi:MAG: 3-phosphoshikimate 1-carboxyvinyltransferase [Clostridia bacterium]|nr:3-phosphoshikimate 1-carboxyvinyltransferase [Clostridia bacterium]
MNVKIKPSKQISGEVFAPPSKSYAHRYIISAFLSKSSGFIEGVGSSKDVLATLNALSSIGLSYKIISNGVFVSFVKPSNKPILNCNESGSTLRFLLPVVTALGISAEFTGGGRLLSRPIDDLVKCLNDNGGEFNSFKISGKLKSGDYKINGEVSSQFISGLLFALPLLEGNSRIIIEGNTVSKDYISITLEVLEKFNINIDKTGYGFFVKGNQKYVMPKFMKIEGDYSGASFLLSMGALSSGVTVKNLTENTLQGDRKIIDILSCFGANITKIEDGYTVQKGVLKGITVGCEDIPDLVQILSVVASFAEGETTFLNVKRLKIKESDRIAGIINNLSKAGIKAKYDNGNLTVYGGKPKGSVFLGDNDHRTVMSASVLSAFCEGESEILGAEAVNKSYPEFFKDYESIGGLVDGDI